MEWESLAGLASVPVVVALVGLARAWGLPSNYAPGAAVLAGILWNLLVAPLVPGGIYPAALQGVLAGLAAAGLYDVGHRVDRAD